MDKPHLARRARWAASVVAVAGLAGCGGNLSGQYADASGLMKFNFKAGHKVEMENPFGGGAVEYDYEIKDKALHVMMPQGTQVFPLDDKGCFQVSFVARVCKVES